MKFFRTSLIAGLCLASLSIPCWSKGDAAPEMAPLFAAKRRFVTNCIWSSEHIRMGGKEINLSITGHGGEHDATALYTLEGRMEGKYEMFEATIGYTDSSAEGRAATFEVWVNGIKASSKGPLVSGEKPEKIRVNIKGAKEIQLRIVPEHYNDTQGATWGDPTLWTKYFDDETPTTISIYGADRTMEQEPNSFKGEQEIEIPIPLFSGTHEYKLIMEYDAERQRVKYNLVHESAHPETGRVEFKTLKKR